MNKYRNIAFTALNTAVLVIISMLSVPIGGVPLSFQCLAVAMGGYICGAKSAMAATAVYIALGAVGLPVFSGFRAGASVLFDYTGGFIWGFFAIALLCGIARGKGNTASIAAGLLGLIICHTAGVLQFRAVAGVSIKSALLTASAPFLIKDVLLIIAAKLLSTQILRALSKNKNNK